MHRVAAFVTLTLLGSLALAQPVARPQGKNCDIPDPPADAGEEINHGYVLRVFPRAKDIGASYTGCQLLWHPVGSKWLTVAVTQVVNGDPVRVWSPEDPKGSRSACAYRQGRVIRGNPETCPSPRFLLVKSLPPGCAERIRSQATDSSAAGSWPSDCQYD